MRSVITGWPSRGRSTTRLKPRPRATMPRQPTARAAGRLRPRVWKLAATSPEASVVQSPSAKLIMRELR
jgi:hypothetical protein